jgi:hypothetical protein
MFTIFRRVEDPGRVRTDRVDAVGGIRSAGPEEGGRRYYGACGVH